jgi:hypothetical protein
MKSAKLVCVALMTLLTALALPVQLAAQRTNGLIAFTQLINGTDGPSNVFIANPDGSNVQPVQLPPDDPAETLGVPIWSPDGTELLISHTFRCDNFGNCFFQPATVDPSGSNFNQLVPPNPPGASSDSMDCEAWFTSGTRILCAFGGNPTAGVFSINASDGGDAVRLTSNPYSASGGDQPTDVSPDGTQFLFVRERTKRNPNDPTPHSQGALFIENTNGTGLRQLAAAGKLNFAGITPAARFSPDGTSGNWGTGRYSRSTLTEAVTPTSIYRSPLHISHSGPLGRRMALGSFSACSSMAARVSTRPTPTAPM